jgi:hypothetical protein
MLDKLTQTSGFVNYPIQLVIKPFFALSGLLPVCHDPDFGKLTCASVCVLRHRTGHQRSHLYVIEAIRRARLGSYCEMLTNERRLYLVDYARRTIMLNLVPRCSFISVA